MRTVSVASDLFDLSLHFLSILFISLVTLLFPLPDNFNFHDVLINTLRTSAEDFGTLAENNSSTGYEPNDHFITEAYVEYTWESSSEQWFPEDFDYDDITIGQTLFNACRRRADHSEEEGLSSFLSSLSMSHDRTGKSVVCRDMSHERCQEIQRQNSESEQIRTLLDRRREQIFAECQAEIRKHNSRPIMTEEVYKN